MLERVYTKKEWTEALEGLRSAYRIFVPVKEGDFHNFRALQNGVQPGFEFQNTRLSPKGILYPPSERMFECDLAEKAAEGNVYRETGKDYPPQAIVGIRPCDAQGFQIVKRNFDNPEFRDPWWVKRYETTVMVGLGCEEPCSTCFCTSVGGGPFGEEGLDVLLCAMGDQFLARALTERGEGFLKEAGGGAEAGEAVLSKAKAVEKAAREKWAEAWPRTGSGRRSSTTCSVPPSGTRWPFPASTAGHAPICVPPAGVSTSRTRCWGKLRTGSATGTPACSPCSPCMGRGTTLETRRRSG